MGRGEAGKGREVRRGVSESRLNWIPQLERELW